MNVYHHHMIHICSACSACSCCHPRRDEAERSASETSLSSLSPFSLLDTLGNLAHVVAMASLLHLSAEDTQHEDVSTAPEPVASPTTTTAPGTATTTANDAIRETLRTLFARAEHTTSPAADRASDDAEVALTPIAAAFLAAFRDQPTLA